jgi:hypothetical protein
MATSSGRFVGVLFLFVTSACFQPGNEFPDGGAKKDAGPVERVCGKAGDGPQSITFLSPNSNETVGCTRFLGSLTISVGDPPGLSALRGLREAERMYIYFSLVRSLSGLEDLTTVGELKIFENNTLENIEALANLSNVKKLVIGLNPSLKSLDGLSGIRELDELTIQDNVSLTSLSGLPNLIRVRGDLTLYGNTSFKPGEVSAFLSRLKVDGRTILQ